MTSRNIFTYLVLTGVFWIVGYYIPIRWSSHFLQADNGHIYVHVFYGCLLVLGLLGRVPVPKGIPKAVLVGAVIGIVSSLIAIFLVELTRVGFDVVKERFEREGGVLTVTAFWSGYSVILGAPLWGGTLAVVCQVLIRLRRSTPQE